MITSANQQAEDLREHVQTYRSFLKVGALFVFHAAVILTLMAYFLL